MEVRYALRNRSEAPLYGFPIACGNELVYDLSPACHWGDGTARELSVRFDGANLATDWLEIEGFPESDVKQEGTNWFYMAKNFAFRGAKPIKLKYKAVSPGNVHELLARRIPSDKYEIEVVKEEKAYPTSNLSDMNFSTAYVVPGKGEDNYILIRFHKPTSIWAFALVNGYHKDKSTYLNNNRLSTVSIEIDDAFNRTIDFASNGLSGDSRTYYENNEYEPLSFGNMIGHPDVAFYRVMTYTGPIKEIKLGLSAIYPGAKYDDTCISEIIFFGKK